MKRMLFAMLVVSTPALATEAEVVAATATRTGETWRFDVTIAHPDTGWDHYADGWWVLGEDGTELGYRKLLHPHVDEQPFTRSLSGVRVPAGTTTVYIRAHDSVHGQGASRLAVELN